MYDWLKKLLLYTSNVKAVRDIQRIFKECWLHKGLSFDVQRLEESIHILLQQIIVFSGVGMHKKIWKLVLLLTFVPLQVIFTHRSMLDCKATWRKEVVCVEVQKDFQYNLAFKKARLKV